jgi:hypothetical protein
MRLSSLLRFVALTTLGALCLVVLAPGCGRSSLEIEPLPDARSEVGTCGPSTCPNGCCDRLGTCRIGADTQACGSRGQLCSDCIANGFQFCDVSHGKVCARESANCGSGECPAGCCNFDSGRATCLAGTDPTACGRSGNVCSDCAQEGRSCDTLSRLCSVGKCDATNCKGCCVGDQCLPGFDNQACGSVGQACVSCMQTGQTCGAGPNGGQCQGTPACGPQNCDGCCNGTTCVAGSDSIACGKQGEACTDCTATGRQCVAQGQPNERTCQVPVLCGPANCPGCCVGNACVVATTPAACGKGGAACQGCAANESCNAGVCTPAANCGPANCPGCCVGNDVCAVGSQNTACGLAGTQCVNCSGLGQVCQGGACQVPTCGPANCAGCCSGNVCVLGTQDAACGQNGAACSDCTPANQVCIGRVCAAKCGPANCAGCCTAGNVCALGFTGGACGSGGANCTDCLGAGATCNTLTLPRLCANQAGVCPAAYPACPAGTTTPITPSLQNVCDDVADLDALQAGCDGGNCEGAFAALAAINPACAACLAPFNVPFSQGTGIYRCAAPFVSAACNGTTGCASDCQDTSCAQCPAGNDDQCKAVVSTAGGQCDAFGKGVGCIAPAVRGGGLCRFDNKTFGGWLRIVGDHFCGNGP